MTTTVRTKLKVVDADGHYVEPATALVDYIDPKYRDVAPRRVRQPDGTERREGRHWYYYNPQSGAPNFQRTDQMDSRLMGLYRKEDKPEVAVYRNVDETHVDSRARLKIMDSEGMDVAVLYPTTALMWMSDPEYHMAVNRALNDWLGDWCKADSQRLYGAANIVAIHDVDAACAELTRCVKQHGFKAAFLRTCTPGPEARWWGDQYDQFWATCQELDVAVGFHPHPGDSMFGSARLFDLMGPTPLQHFMRTPFNVVVDAMNVVMGLAVGGILERFPRLRFAILEASGGWLVSFLERLDYRCVSMRHNVPAMKQRPSDYFRRQGWISFDPHEAALKMTADWLGADRIVWGSDYPHPDAFYPNFMGMLDKNIAPLPQDQKERIRGLNAVDLYKLE